MTAFCFLLAFCPALPSSYRVDRGRHLARRRPSLGCSVDHAGCPHARAETAPIPARSDADRPAPAGWAALRLLADVDISFSRNRCWQIRRWTLALGRPAPMLTSASPGWAAAMVPAPQRATGSSATIANSAAPTVVLSAACSLSDISGWRAGVLYPLAGGRRRIRRGAFRPARAAWAALRLLTTSRISC